MATAVVEKPEVMVSDQLIPLQEFDRVRNAVCLLRPNDLSKSWSATGFYANVKLKKHDKLFNVHCIMTNYHVFLEMKKRGDGMVAVFHHESTEKESNEFALEPFVLFAHSKVLDYVLIGIDENLMASIGVKPILAHSSELPIVTSDDTVCIIQHPGGKMKHFSQGAVKRVNKPCIEYYADTLGGSSGAPVFVVKESKLLLVGLHSKGLSHQSNWNKGVLLSEILHHLHTGKVTTPNFLSIGVPCQMESGFNLIGISGTERWKDVKLRFAIMGDSGAGKSAFINAIRGIEDDDDGAAEVDVTETRTQPKEYKHPENHDVSFVYLPGIGTSNYPDLPTYDKKVGLEDYDTFLIFTTTRFTKNDLELAKRVKSLGKPFFLIRTKIDVDLTPKKGTAAINEEAILRKIRNNCMDNVEDLISSEKEIFLISNYDTDKYDFNRLIEAMSELPVLQSQNETTVLNEECLAINEEYLADTKAYIDKNGVSGIKEFLDKKFEGWKRVKIQFAITGDSGSGKSAFINAIRGLNDYDKGAAKVGEIETTTDPKEYKHPDNPMISFVDLPGIGTPNYPDLPTYCEKVGFENYDTFLIFTATRFTQNDLDLAKKVKNLGKSFFLIRTKIDVDLMRKKGKAPINEAAMLQEIKSKIVYNVKNLASSEKEIFLIGNYDKDKWDFDRLIEAISNALPVRQRETLTYSLSNVTRECLKRKASFLKASAVLVAVVSAGTGRIDRVIIEGAIGYYHRLFGLKIKSEEIEFLVNTYWQDSIKEGGAIFALERVVKYGLVVGVTIAGTKSFILALQYLVRSVNELEKAALAVWDNAVKQINSG